MITCTSFQLVNQLVKYNHQAILDQYPNSLYKLEQQADLVSSLVRTGQVRRVIKVSRPFYAIKGKFHFKHQISESELLYFQPDFYVTFSTELTGKVEHQHLEDKDGNVLTVVEVTDVKRVPWTTFNESEFEEVVNFGCLVDEIDDVISIDLYKPDLDRFLGVVAVCDKDPFEYSPVNRADTGSLLNILQDKTGARNHPEAIELAIASVEQSERDRHYQEHSPAYAALKNEIRKAEKVGLHARNLSEMVSVFESYEGLKSRQPLVCSQVMFEIGFK